MPQSEYRQVIMDHLRRIHQFYGEFKGVLLARKHIGWYLAHLGAAAYRQKFNQVTTVQEQIDVLSHFFDTVF